jgi:transposase
VKILGMDLGQGKSAWELFDTNTGEVMNGKVGMDEPSLRKLLNKLQPDCLVIESGPLAARVHDLAVASGVAVQVADTTEDAWQWKNVKRKTDADDAGKLVRLAALGQINRVHIPAPAVRERRHLLEYRRSLVVEQTRCKNRIRATLVLQGLKLPAGKSGWSESARAWLRQTLNQAAWMAVRFNPALRAFFLRIGGGSKKRRKSAIVALMRKLLVIAWAMLRDGRLYEAQPSQSAKPTAA